MGACGHPIREVTDDSMQVVRRHGLEGTSDVTEQLYVSREGMIPEANRCPSRPPTVSVHLTACALKSSYVPDQWALVTLSEFTNVSASWRYSRI